MASTGDITLTGHQVQQNGVALASTSVDTRGTIHLLNSATDTTGSVTLGEGSTTAILLDSSGSTALNGQKDNGLIKLDGTPANLITGQFNNLSAVPDRTDQSRIEIVSGGTVDFQKRLDHPGYRWAGRGQCHRAQPGTRRGDDRCLRGGRCQGVDGIQQHQDQRTGQRAARRTGQP